MQPVETVVVDSRTVACDGDGTLGHPRVFLNIGAGDAIDCPYCGRRFTLRNNPEAPAADHGAAETGGSPDRAR